MVLLSFALCVVAVVPLGSAEAALRLTAVPVMFAALFGISAETRAGNCACGRVPLVRSDADTVTLPLKAWPLTVVDVATAPRFASAAEAELAPVPPFAMATTPETAWQPEVVAPPFASVQRVIPAPVTVPAVRIFASVP